MALLHDNPAALIHMLQQHGAPPGMLQPEPTTHDELVLMLTTRSRLVRRPRPQQPPSLR